MRPSLALAVALRTAAVRGRPAGSRAAASLSVPVADTETPAPSDDPNTRTLALGGAGPRVTLSLSRLGASPGAAVTAATPGVSVVTSAVLTNLARISDDRARAGDAGKPTAEFRDRSAGARGAGRRGGDGAPPPEASARAMMTAALTAGGPAAPTHVAAALRGGVPADALPPVIAAAAVAAAAAGAPLTHALGVARVYADASGTTSAWPDAAARVEAAVDALVVTAGGADAAVDVTAREASIDAVLATLAIARARAIETEPGVAKEARFAATGLPPQPPRPPFVDPAAAAAYEAALTPHLDTALAAAATPLTGPSLGAALAFARAAAVRDLRARGAWRAPYARVPGSGCVSQADEEGAAPTIIAAALARRARAGEPRAGARGSRDVRPLSLTPAQVGDAHGASEASIGATRVSSIVTIHVDKGADTVAPQGAGRLRASLARAAHAPPPTIPHPAIGARASSWPADYDAMATLDRALAGVLPAGGDGAPAALPWPFAARAAVDVHACDGGVAGPALAAVSLALATAGAPLPRCVGGRDVALQVERGEDENSPARWHLAVDPTAVELAAAAATVTVTATATGITSARVEARSAGGAPSDAVNSALRAAAEAAAADAAAADAAVATLQAGASFGAITIAKDLTGRVLGVGGSQLRALEGATGTLIALGPEDPPAAPSGDDAPLPPPSMDAPQVARYYAPTSAAAIALEARVAGITGADIVAGATFDATVTDVADFGAFVLLPGGARELVHISELAHHRVASVEDVVSVGDSIKIVCLGRDARGLLRLSRKAALPSPGGGEGDGWRGGGEGRPQRGDRRGGGGDRGSRGGDRGGRPPPRRR